MGATRKKAFASALAAAVLGVGAGFGFSAGGTSSAAPAVTTCLTHQLTANKASVEVTGLPAGTAKIHYAEGQDANMTGILYGDRAPSVTIYTPKPDHPVVDEIALNSEGKVISTGCAWAGRQPTVPGGTGTGTTETTPPPPPPSALKVGLDSGGWTLTNDSALTSGKMKILRKQKASDEYLTSQESKGWKTIDLIGSNPATTQNFSALASEGLARVRAHPAIIATEVLNEPQNPYLGGSESQANIEAYAHGINTVAAAYKAAGVTVPVLWSADGGYAGVPSWGAKVWPLLDTNAKASARETVHPYGGTGSREESAKGGRKRVEEAFSLTGHKVWVTEVGWPTCVGCANTGDSLQWTEAEQAHNIESFIKWAPAFAEEVTIFQYRDYSPNNYYGIETSGGTHKLSYNVLESLAGEEVITPPPPPTQPHLALVILENRSRTQAFAGVPYLGKLASEFGNTTEWHAVAHPSLPNYLALASGSIHEVKDDSCSYSFTSESLASQLSKAGISWKAYLEGLPSVGSTACTSGAYAKKHDPFAYFTTTDNSRRVPGSQLAADEASNTVPSFVLYVPDLNNDGHEGCDSCVNSKLESLVKGLTANAWYTQGKGSIIVTYDEDANNEGNRIATVVVHAGNKGKTVGYGRHYATLRTIEDAYKLPRLGSAASTAYTLATLIE